MSSHSTLFDSLQKEFCPPLDSSLLAALLADFESDKGGNATKPSSYQLDDLRATLRELSAQADESQLFEFSDLRLTSPTDDTSSTPDFYHGNTATSSSLSSDFSETPRHSFSSPLGFLQAALPHIPTTKLSSALEQADNNEEMDMWDIVAGILTDEYIRELEERGFDDDGNLEQILHVGDTTWATAGVKKPRRAPITSPGKRRNKRVVPITLVDVRQQQHARQRPETGYARPTPAPDPWTQLSSLSSHLATLLPPHPPSFFQSYFHSPDYSTPYEALCASLTSICKDYPTSQLDKHTTTLFALLDILLPEYDALDPEQRGRLLSDTELSLRATAGRGDDALDLVKLLRELDSDSASGYLEMGVYHFSPPAVESRARSKLPTEPPAVQPPPLSKNSQPPKPSTRKPSPFQWQTVPRRTVTSRNPHPLANYIPAYARDVNGMKVRGDIGELDEHRRKMRENMRRRNELLREATRMWQRGNAKTRGGEVALYFAERAREFQELAKKEALNAALQMVEAKRMASQDHTTVDLHGTTVAEAVIIVREILEHQNCLPNEPLKIITGRGAHSAKQVSVLKPAVKNALVEDGWIVGAWDGGLIVRGKRIG